MQVETYAVPAFGSFKTKRGRNVAFQFQIFFSGGLFLVLLGKFILPWP